MGLANWIIVDILCPVFPPLLPLSSSSSFCFSTQMCHQRLTISWFAVVLLASPLMAIWELEKGGKQSFLASCGAPVSKPEPRAATGKGNQNGLPYMRSPQESLTLGKMQGYPRPTSSISGVSLCLVWFLCWMKRVSVDCGNNGDMTFV